MLVGKALSLLAVILTTLAGSVPACTKPSLRQEWRELSSAQKKGFLDAVKCLATLPHSPTVMPDGSQAGIQPVNQTSSRYDDFVYAHMDGVTRNHYTGVFLAWHRYFLFTLEDNLRADCGFTGTLPYWDWSRDTANIAAAPPFTSDPNTGFGTFSSNNSTGFAVTDGAFGRTMRAYPTPHLTGRHFRPQPWTMDILPGVHFNEPEKFAVTAFTPDEVKYIITHFVGNYTKFQSYMDGFRAEGMHNAVHLMLQGDMADLSHSPNDPIFFLHHGNLDRIWADWQAHDPLNAFAVGGGQTQNFTDFDMWLAGSPPFVTANDQLAFSGLTDNPRIKDVLSTTGGKLCYKYST